jgi:hypothetical protein
MDLYIYKLSGLICFQVGSCIILGYYTNNSIDLIKEIIHNRNRQLAFLNIRSDDSLIGKLSELVCFNKILIRDRFYYLNDFVMIENNE